ncbi:GIY-YIG nuclease family protein [Zunongwangia sp. SCSIO 43204]|uniref:GIY-YIG nuclease family protein n=1 Tax=Zunongwangia sp. SCSIO 43204 TaxID=2779359 RepID=UPI001CA909DC|nr:GIY-YIG nuclease family protein [Zunongwangia sp. SCSIO 43204]UAB83326.1 GIY-YIG nuclease family protein [Zunongwangia sp. SCSIO 43204]
MGKKLTVFMIDGTAYGPRLSEIGNWVGKAIYSPRASVNKIMNRSEFDNPGIYCLKGDPTDDAYDEKIYIGEAENIKARLKQHLSDPNKDFKELIFFVSKDELLTKTQIRYLESRLVQLAIEAKTAQIDNGNSPSLPTLHEADISDMEYFLEQIKLILPVMGFKFLISSTAKQEKIENRETENFVHETYFIRTNSFKASMKETDQGYIILKGSEAKKKLSNSCTETYRNLRRKLLETNILVEFNDKLIFAEDAVFNSPSAASNMVLGRNSNGFTEWISEKGKSFREVQEIINN